MMMYFDHWKKVPANLWPWLNFSPEEMACRATGKIGFDRDTMDKLQDLRTYLGSPLMINSAYRSPEHNTAVGGAPHSFHPKGKAFDVSMANHDPQEFEAAARAVGFTGFGFYRRNNFMHIDTGPDREWGARWPTTSAVEIRPTPKFSPPPPRLPETIGEDGKAKGIGAGATGGTALIVALVPAIGKLDPVAQGLAVVGIIMLVLGLGYLAQDKLREWLA